MILQFLNANSRKNPIKMLLILSCIVKMDLFNFGGKNDLQLPFTSDGIKTVWNMNMLTQKYMVVQAIENLHYIH